MMDFICINIWNPLPVQWVRWEVTDTLGRSNTTLQIFFYNGGTRLPSVYETFSNICHSAWALKFNGAFGKRFVFFWGGGGVEAEWDAFVRDKFFAKEARTISLIPLTDKICK